MYLRAGNLFCLTRSAHTMLNPTGDTLESPSRIPPAQIWGVLRAWFQTLPQQLPTDNIGLIPLLHSSQAAVPMVHQLLLLHVNSLDLQTSLGNREMADRINLHCVEETNSCYNTFLFFFSVHNVLSRISFNSVAGSLSQQPTEHRSARKNCWEGQEEVIYRHFLRTKEKKKKSSFFQTGTNCETLSHIVHTIWAWAKGVSPARGKY